MANGARGEVGPCLPVVIFGQLFCLGQRRLDCGREELRFPYRV